MGTKGLKHHQSNKLNEFVKRDVLLFFWPRIEIIQVLPAFKRDPEGRIGYQYIENNTWARADMKFLFECLTR